MNQKLSVILAAILALAGCDKEHSQAPEVPTASASLSASAAVASLPLVASTAHQDEDFANVPENPDDIEPADISKVVAASKEQIVYFNAEGKHVDQRTNGGFFRKVIGQMPDGRVVVQDFYEETGRKQTSPVILKAGADINSFESKGVLDSRVIWYGTDGKVEGIASYQDGKLNYGYSYVDGVLASATNDNSSVLFYTGSRQPIARFSVLSDGKMNRILYWANGQKAQDMVSNDEGKIVSLLLWDEGGNAVQNFAKNPDFIQKIRALEQQVQQLSSKIAPNESNAKGAASAPK